VKSHTNPSLLYFAILLVNVNVTVSHEMVLNVLKEVTDAELQTAVAVTLTKVKVGQSQSLSRYMITVYSK